MGDRHHQAPTVTRAGKAKPERVELALNGATLGLWDLNWQTEQMVINSRWAGMIGYKVNEFAYTHSAWKSLIHHEDIPHSMRMLEMQLSGETEELNVEFRMLHQKGHWVWVHSKRRVVVRDAFGRPLRMVGTHMDITERKNFDDEIKRLAYYDSLTDLPNRRLLIDRLRQALAASERNMQ